ncbi:MAG: transposase [Tannerella sp.]|jgi:hypothetical protein|nr:transposase [Tannerella sp.]
MEVLADQIYCTQAKRKMFKEKGILLKVKPLGRLSALSIHASPGECNPVEGKFGQVKTGYGLNRIKARLQGTSEQNILGVNLRCSFSGGDRYIPLDEAASLAEE